METVVERSAAAIEPRPEAAGEEDEEEEEEAAAAVGEGEDVKVVAATIRVLLLIRPSSLLH